MSNGDAEDVPTMLKEDAPHPQQGTTHPSGSMLITADSAGQTKDEAAQSGSTGSRWDRFCHHVFLLPVYVGYAAGLTGTVLLAGLLCWLVCLYWPYFLVLTVAALVLLWIALAFDHYESHGWQYKPDEPEKQEDNGCRKDQ